MTNNIRLNDQSHNKQIRLRGRYIIVLCLLLVLLVYYYLIIYMYSMVVCCILVCIIYNLVFNVLVFCYIIVLSLLLVLLLVVTTMLLLLCLPISITISTSTEWDTTPSGAKYYDHYYQYDSIMCIITMVIHYYSIIIPLCVLLFIHYYSIIHYGLVYLSHAISLTGKLYYDYDGHCYIIMFIITVLIISSSTF